MDTNILTLDKLPLNHMGYIKKINCNDKLKRRLLDLGLIEGTIICPVFKSPFNNPRAFEVRGSIIAIRTEDSKNIEIDI